MFLTSIHTNIVIYILIDNLFELEDRCVESCPINYTPLTTANGTQRCIDCGGPCPKGEHLFRIFYKSVSTFKINTNCSDVLISFYYYKLRFILFVLIVECTGGSTFTDVDFTDCTLITGSLRIGGVRVDDE